ncbi:cell division protein [Bacteroidia bacterium]|nr:cell division protein [Bacteroidia bacterium]
MKTKFYLFGLAISFVFLFSACKAKQSYYMQSYEAAKAQEAQQATRPATEFTPVEKAKPTTTENFQREKVTVVGTNSQLKQYSVVIGSFVNKTNAESLRDRMAAQGYNALLAQNEKGMYRVIVATFDDKDRAAAERQVIKNKFAPDFSDAWLLDSGY